MKYLISIILILSFLSCEQADEFSPSRIKENFELKLEDNNMPADGVSIIKVIAEFPADFNTEADDKVDFTVFKESSENTMSDIILTEINGEDKKIAELLITHDQVDSLRVVAVIKINDITVSREAYANFKKAFPDSINVTTPSLQISPNTFDEITLTTQLIRSTGIVSKNSIAETVVIDSLGVNRGIFNNYSNRTDIEGKVTNKFTLGSDNYIGSLFIIATSLNEQNEIVSDTLNIFSQNP